MEALFYSKKLFFIILAFSLTINFSSQSVEAKRPYQEASTKFIRTSCITTTYPRLCHGSLLKYASSIKWNRFFLTVTALHVTLASTKSTSAMMSSLSKNTGLRLKPREVAAMKDCVEGLSDSVDELWKSISELGPSRVRSPELERVMNDVQTWVNTALTDETTCTDGFKGKDMDGAVRATVRGATWFRWLS